jgi:hypothetical protein
MLSIASDPRLACGRAASALSFLLIASACGGVTSETDVVAPSGVRCNVSASVSSGMVAYTGGTSTVTVTASRDCGWTAGADATWITVSPQSGSGNATVRVTIAANLQPSSRTARVAVNDSRIEFVQQPAPPPVEPPPTAATPPPPATNPSPQPTPPSSPVQPSCTFELSRSSDTFEARGGEGEVRVRSRQGCQWRASSNAEWISITSGSSGSGDGDVRYKVSDHTSTQERSGTISIAGQGFSIRQRAAEPVRPGRVEVQGRVTSVSGSCPSLSIGVRGEPVITDSSTRFQGSCSRIRVGVQVEVRGQRIGTGPVRAEEVTLRDDDDDDDDDRIVG